jgi:hypothetical protein
MPALPAAIGAVALPFAAAITGEQFHIRGLPIFDGRPITEGPLTIGGPATIGALAIIGRIVASVITTGPATVITGTGAATTAGIRSTAAAWSAGVRIGRTSLSACFEGHSKGKTEHQINAIVFGRAAPTSAHRARTTAPRLAPGRDCDGKVISP